MRLEVLGVVEFGVGQLRERVAFNVRVGLDRFEVRLLRHSDVEPEVDKKVPKEREPGKRHGDNER